MYLHGIHLYQWTIMVFHNEQEYNESMKQLIGTTTLIIETLCTIDSKWWQGEKLNILNYNGLLKALGKLNLLWKSSNIAGWIFVSLFLITLTWLDKLYDSCDMLLFFEFIFK